MKDGMKWEVEMNWWMGEHHITSNPLIWWNEISSIEGADSNKSTQTPFHSTQKQKKNKVFFSFLFHSIKFDLFYCGIN